MKALTIAYAILGSVVAVAFLGQDNSMAVIEGASKAVVVIKGQTSDGGEITGSGFIVDPSGTVVTNLHVIKGVQKAAVKLSNNDIYDSVFVRAYDERKDIAIIQVPGYNLPTIQLGDSDTVKAGERVYLIGNAIGVLERSVSSGVISGIRAMTEGYNVIQTDAAASHGNSGGPLIDSSGNVLGILTFKLTAGESLNFVVPINYAKGLLTVDEKIPLRELSGHLIGITEFSSSAPSFPKRWKSLASGTTKVVRLDKDHLYIETIVPEANRSAGDFSLSELTKSNGKWVGTTKARITCSWLMGMFHAGPRKFNTCTLEVPIEITMLSESRIEGSAEGYPEGDKFNCKSCDHSAKRTWMPFVWIPE